MKNYKKISEQLLKEVNAKMTIYEHIKTGAHICTFDTDDTNKVFAIAFKTPAIDSTGVTHIIEHTVLCGSKKYPVKDPFVELLKGSLNTFLNAITYPDKTVYPCASKNDKDFRNIMDIYLNAVFYPRIYDTKNIFYQEGWHYEIFDKKDPIKLNGVVYNEMKGAFSDKNDVMVSHLVQGLYDNGTYRFESGGDPECIPTLTYENYINFHKNYYSPSNAYIYLYGKMDMEERLAYLDKEYLSKFEKIDIHPEIALSKDFSKIKEETVLYPVNSEEEMKGNSTNIGIAYNLYKSSDTKEGIAFDILDKVLFNSSSAYVKNKLLAAHLCDEVDSGTNDGTLESSYIVLAEGTVDENKQKILDLLNESYKELINGKLDHNAILATISNSEFVIRENKFGRYRFGLSIILRSLDTWLYNDNEPALKLDILKYYEELKEDLNTGYFEKLIEKYFLNSKHEIVVTQKPSLTIQNEKEKVLTDKLAKYKASLSDKEVDELIKMNNDLRAYQTKEDSPIALASIPHLTLDDLRNDKVDEYPINKVHQDFDYYYAEKFTNAVIYGGYYFDLKRIPKKYYPEISLLSSLYTRLSTKNYSVEKLEEAINLLTGNLASNISIENKYNSDEYSTYFAFDFSSLNENLHKVTLMVNELITNTIFDNEAKLLEVLNNEKTKLEMLSVRNGHMFSLTRAASYMSESGYLNDQIRGIGYYDFVMDLIKNFKTKKEELLSDLKYLTSIIFTKENFFAYSTLEKKDLKAFESESKGLYSTLISNKEEIKDDKKKKKEQVFEGISAALDVNFVSRFNNERLFEPYGKSQVLVK